MNDLPVFSVLSCLCWSEEESEKILAEQEIPTEIAVVFVRTAEGRLAGEEIPSLLDELSDFGDCVRIQPDPRKPGSESIEASDFLLVGVIPTDTREAFKGLFERPYISRVSYGFSKDREEIRRILESQGAETRPMIEPKPEELLTQAKSFMLEREMSNQENPIEEMELPATDEQKNSVTAPKGFRSSGVHAGIKKKRRDVSILVSDYPCVCAGRFTQNRFLSPSVRISKEHLALGDIRAVVSNSGNANAATGRRGMEDAKRMTEIAAENLSLKPEQMLVCSTGLIGAFLPMDKIEAGIREASQTLASGEDDRIIEAIMTTDVRRKSSVRRFTIEEKDVTIGGIAKGAGMIHPNMATMHAYITTDARIAHEALDAALGEAVDRSFNALSVDGDTSTSDCVLMFANGQAENEEITLDHPSYSSFKSQLKQVCIDLARQMARDGEGANHLVRIVCQGAATTEEALEIGRTLATSLLVKTAIFGRDANWGRIIAAIGRTNATFDPDQVKVWIADVLLFSDGMATEYDEARVEAGMAEEEVEIRVDLGAGEAEMTVYTCDLSYDYVRINAEYHT
ncbi:MAG: bifunctional glutamate N-acetyltransferase/amino-acid acetyltransferase ArgJ [Candidatus Omnitrophica bacterium]|nr:bifunctional glutamate N-acetyltransferase/amino-acid acetyltransferase ArgJ [Candidatus Omnitrophota bacterium]